MITVNDLKEGDILYALDCERKNIEIYSINSKPIYNMGIDSKTRLDYTVLIGDPYRVYIMFPDNCDLEEAILCKYNEASYWIYTTNFNQLQKYINSENIIQRFPINLDIWKQKFEKNMFYAG